MPHCRITNSRWDCGHLECQGDESPVESKYWVRLRAVFWTAYILVPLLTGLLAYHWLPDESYSEERHNLLESHEVEDREDNYVDHPDVWEDKVTGAVYTYDGFAKHRHSEAIRMALAWFAYGLLGCWFFSYVSSRKNHIRFCTVFKHAIAVNFAVAAFTLIHIW